MKVTKETLAKMTSTERLALLTDAVARSAQSIQDLSKTFERCTEQLNPLKK